MPSWPPSSATSTSIPITLPWVEQTPGVWFKLLRTSPSEERYTNLLKVAPGGLLARHRTPARSRRG